MKLVSYTTAKGAASFGYPRGDGIIDLPRAVAVFRVAEDRPLDPLAPTLGDVLELRQFDVTLFQQVASFVEIHDLGKRLAAEDPMLLAPLFPKRIIALGRNYAAHAAETGHEAPKEPVFFMKAASTVVGPEEAVVCPKGVGRIDHEVELAVVIGKRGKRISRTKAMELVAGYTILNDVTARDMQTRDMALSHPWFLSKSFDTFGPMGPCLVTADEIPDPHRLELKLTVNGEVRQHSNTSNLIFKTPELIASLSRYLTLEPGDVISTGTPDGISPIEPGDVMEAAVEDIGTLRNPVVAEE
jgi:2-keto-4-pentenoate hydratase/2-oxohepta-3-ene-1,7-dioic acid hydratase in catechol pathway